MVESLENHKKVAVLIGCSDYSRVERFADLPSAKIDIAFVAHVLKYFGFEDVRILEEPTPKQVGLALNKLALESYNNKEEEKIDTLSFVFYSGHGLINSAGQSLQTEMLLNEAGGLVTYPLEK